MRSSSVFTVSSSYGIRLRWLCCLEKWQSDKILSFDLDMTYRAMMQACDQLKIEAKLINSAQKEGYSLETKGTPMPMHIDILPLEKSAAVTTVVISISVFGDKQYVGLFYNLVDDNLYKKGSH